MRSWSEWFDRVACCGEWGEFCCARSDVRVVKGERGETASATTSVSHNSASSSNASVSGSHYPKCLDISSIPYPVILKRLCAHMKCVQLCMIYIH